MYYKEMLDRSPNAKIVLTVRDPEKWLTSVRSTIYFMHPLMNSPISRYFLMPVNTVLQPWLTRWSRWANETIWERQWLRGEPIKSLNEPDDVVLPVVKRKWDNWIAEIKQNVPADRLVSIFKYCENTTPLFSQYRCGS